MWTEIELITWFGLDITRSGAIPKYHLLRSRTPSDLSGFSSHHLISEALNDAEAPCFCHLRSLAWFLPRVSDDPPNLPWVPSHSMLFVEGVKKNSTDPSIQSKRESEWVSAHETPWVCAPLFCGLTVVNSHFLRWETVRTSQLCVLIWSFIFSVSSFSLISHLPSPRETTESEESHHCVHKVWWRLASGGESWKLIRKTPLLLLPSFLRVPSDSMPTPFEFHFRKLKRSLGTRKRLPLI